MTKMTLVHPKEMKPSPTQKNLRHECHINTIAVHPHAFALHDNIDQVPRVFTIQPIERLPQVDANVTILSAILRKKKDMEFNLKLLKTAQQLTPAFFVANGIYGICVMPSFVLVDDPTLWAIGCLFALLVMVPSNLFFIATLSNDIFWLIITTFEFQYLTIINLSNQIIWLLLFRDSARFLGFVAGTIALESALMTDAAFYLRSHAARCLTIGSALAPGTVILIRLGLAPRQSNISFSIWGRNVDLLDVFVYNLFVTAWLIMGKAWPLMRLLRRNSNIDPFVCGMYYPLSHLVPIKSKSPPASLKSLNSRPILKSSISRASSVSRSTNNGLELKPTEKYRRIDETKQIGPSSLLRKLDSPTYMKVHSSVGWIGLIAWMVALTWHIVEVKQSSQVPLIWIFAVVGLSFTIIYCVVCASYYQSTLVACLTRQGDAWFVSVQFTIFTIVACIMLHWDYRCLFLWSPWLWCHWILFLDALTPHSRHILSYQRRMVLVVEVVLVLYPLSMIYWIYFSRDPNLFNHVYSIPLPRHLTLRMSLTSILSSDLVGIWIWMGRFLWRELYRPKHALKFIKQQVQYRGGFTI